MGLRPRGEAGPLPIHGQPGPTPALLHGPGRRPVAVPSRGFRVRPFQRSWYLDRTFGTLIRMRTPKWKLSTCPDCGTSREIRIDSKAERCRPCASRIKSSRPRPDLVRGDFSRCQFCGGEYWVTPSNLTKRFCSRACATDSRSLDSEERKRRRAARQAANNAVRDRRLKEHECRDCGSLNAQMHHEDYSDALGVLWLCRACHTKLHRGRGDLVSVSRLG